MLLEEKYLKELKKSSFNFSKDEIKICRHFFVELREIDQLIWKESPEQLFESQWALLGIVSRSYQLSLSSIQQIYSKNFNGYYCSVRGLMETLSGIIWSNENRERLKSFVQFTPLKIGRLMNSSYKKYPQLKNLYSKLSNIAHPNRDSHLLGFRKKEEIENGVIGFMSPFDMDFSNYFANEKMKILIVLLVAIITELRIITSHNDSIKNGKVMVSIKKRVATK
jgi:hypothetical protein